MKPQEVKAVLGDLPHMPLYQGERIAKFLREHNLRSCLEIGFLHGVSSAYIAAALQELGGGTLTTLDRDVVRTLTPTIDQVLDSLGLGEGVTYIYAPESYTWELMRMLEEDPTPRFDFCYLDGLHTWWEDGFAFLLAERLLKPGGWILFDDLNWCFGDDDPGLSSWPEELRHTPHIRKIWELLVKPHPSFDKFFVEDNNWAFARKRPLSLVRSFWPRLRTR